MNLLAQIEGQARAHPDRVAQVSDGRRLTYGELLGRAEILAGHLAGILGGDRSPVAVHGHKEAELLIAFLAAAKSGHPYVPLDTALPMNRVERIVAAAGARLVLTPEKIADLISRPVPPGLQPHPAGPADPYYIIFTSGSTGEPKGVVITGQNLAGFIDWMLAEQNFTSGEEVFLNQAPFSFDVSVMDLHLSLVTGSTLVCVTSRQIAHPRELFALLGESGATTFSATPSFVRLCLAEKSFAAAMLPRLRRFILAGETLAPAVVAQLLARFPGAKVWNAYGPTEATVLATTVAIDHAMLDRFPALPIGYPRPSSRVLVLDPDGREVPAGARGELVLVGPHVSPGYIGRADLTAQAFFSWNGEPAYRTGDAGHIRDGLVFFDGRIDHQIKLHGFRIEIGDIEANLCALPGVRDAIVVPLERHGQVDALGACVILSDAPTGTEFAQARTLQEALARRLPAYMVPRRFRFLSEFPMTVNGKADRRLLAGRFA